MTEQKFCKVELHMELIAPYPNFKPTFAGDFWPWCYVSFKSIPEVAYDPDQIHQDVLQFLQKAFDKNQSFAIHGDFYEGGAEALVFYASDKGWDIQRAFKPEHLDGYISEEPMTSEDATAWLFLKIQKYAKGNTAWQKEYNATLVQSQHVIDVYRLTSNL